MLSKYLLNEPFIPQDLGGGTSTWSSGCLDARQESGHGLSKYPSPGLRQLQGVCVTHTKTKQASFLEVNLNYEKEFRPFPLGLCLDYEVPEMQ